MGPIGNILPGLSVHGGQESLFNVLPERDPICFYPTVIEEGPIWVNRSFALHLMPSVGPYLRVYFGRREHKFDSLMF